MLKLTWLCSILLAALTLSGCGQGGSELLGKSFPPVHYRMTASVETPKGIVTGSSVIEVTWRAPGTIFGPLGSAGYSVKGEGIVVDLPDNERLYLTLKSPASEDWAAWVVRYVEPAGHSERPSRPDPENHYSELDRYWAAVRADRQVHVIPRYTTRGQTGVENYPYFFRFRNRNDPGSSEFVDPDNLEKTYGSGYKFLSLTLQVTEDPVTQKIDLHFSKDFFKKWEKIREETGHCRQMDHPYFRQPTLILNRAALSRDDTMVGGPRRNMKEVEERVDRLRQVPCENVIPGYTGTKIRDFHKRPIFTHEPANIDTARADIVRWTPQGSILKGNTINKLTSVGGCLALDVYPYPALIVFPYGDGIWDRKTETLLYRGKSYSLDDKISLKGEWVRIFVDGGKADFQRDSRELGKHDFHSCNGYEMFLVDNRAS